MQKWEYMLSDAPARGDGERLNDDGQAGWELAAVVALANGYRRYYFKRPIEGE